MKIFYKTKEIVKYQIHIYPLLHYHIYSGDAEIVTEKLDKGLIDLSAIHGCFTRISV